MISRIRWVLRVNAASCLFFGGLFVSSGTSASVFLSNSPKHSAMIQMIGALLLFNGIHLVLASLRRQISSAELLYFSTGDLLWVAGTAALISLGYFVETSAGIVVALGVAAFVGTLGGIQLKYWKGRTKLLGAQNSSL